MERTERTQRGATTTSSSSSSTPPVVVKDAMQRLFYLRSDGPAGEVLLSSAVCEATGVEAGEQRLVWRGEELGDNTLRVRDVWGLGGNGGATPRRNESLLLLRRTHYASPIPSPNGTTPTLPAPASPTSADHNTSFTFSAGSTVSYLRSLIGSETPPAVSATPPNSAVPQLSSPKPNESLQRRYNALLLEHETSKVELETAKKEIVRLKGKLDGQIKGAELEARRVRGVHAIELKAAREASVDADLSAERAVRMHEEQTENRLRSIRTAAADAIKLAEERVKQADKEALRKYDSSVDETHRALRAEITQLEAEGDVLRRRLDQHESSGNMETARVISTVSSAVAAEPTTAVNERQRMQRRIAFLERELDRVSKRADHSHRHSTKLQSRNNELVDSFQTQRRFIDTIIGPLDSIES